MRRYNLLVFLTLMTVAAQAQFINLGATVTIQSGATLRVETNIENNGTGTITNNGTIEVSGNFTNAGTATLTAGAGLVKFIGGDNTTLNTGGDALFNVEMAKTGNATVTLPLNAPATIAGNLSFTGAGSKIVLGGNDLTLASSTVVSATTDHSTNGYVVTNGAGSLVKKVAGSGMFNFPIGDDASDFSPLQVTFTGGGYSGTSEIKAKVVDSTHPNKPVEADSYISRYWDVDASNITAPYNATMIGTYVSGDNNGTQSRIKGASFISPDWTFSGAATNGTSTVTGTISNTLTNSTSLDFTGMNALNKLNITAYLHGALPSAGPTTMTSTLQNYFGGNDGLLPATSQYGAPTSTYSAINNPGGVVGAVTDWIKVEVRNAANPATILETRSLLLKANGSIVGVDGGIPYFKDQSVPVRVALSHRNHLAILSKTIAGTFEGKNTSYNFSSDLSQADKLDVGDTPQMLIKNGVYCMIAGDVNVNQDYEITGSDLTSVKIQFNLGTAEMYLKEDLNLDGEVGGSDLTTQKISFNAGYFSTLINTL